MNDPLPFVPRKGATVKILPDFRYSVTWNYGRSAATFDDLKDLNDFIQRVLPKLETNPTPADTSPPQQLNEHQRPHSEPW
jgi:hypothetical protein